jgi:hypothetical protein
MKLYELSAQRPTAQIAKVFESYFGSSIKFENLSQRQARGLLNRVKGLVKEYRSTPDFHHSENNPAYLKLVMMEQALVSKISEVGTVAPTGTTQPMDGELARGVAKVAQATGQGGQAQRLTKAIQGTLAGKALDAGSKAALAQHEVGIANLMKDPAQANKLQQMLRQSTAKAATESTKRSRRLKEASEVQQAQVVLAAQDMVDRVQKMLEDSSAMQFKDLPALVDSMKAEVGTEQAAQFNTDATAALTTLVQSLQAAKSQLDTALGVVTGQQTVVPGQDDMGGDMAPVDDMPPAPELDLDADTVDTGDEEELAAVSLGRERR